MYYLDPLAAEAPPAEADAGAALFKAYAQDARAGGRSVHVNHDGPASPPPEVSLRGDLSPEVIG